MNVKRILVIDSNERWRDFFSEILEAGDYTPTAVGDYTTAIRELKQQLYPVAVIDPRLAGSHDEKVLRLIRETDRLWPRSIFRLFVVNSQHVPSIVQEIAALAKTGWGDLMVKGGKDITKFNQPLFMSKVSSGFARSSWPIRCPLSSGNCGKSIEPKMTQAFVAMPYTLKSPGITVNMDDMYRLGIKPALRAAGYRALRADENPFLGALMCNVCQGIMESAICIVDITDWNPNVMLELGLMYGWGKTTIVIKHAKSKVPIDLRFTLYTEYNGLDSLKSRPFSLWDNL